MNQRRSIPSLFVFIVWLFAAAWVPAHAADEALVQGFLAKRQLLITEKKIDIPEMSKAIRTAIADGDRLAREGKDVEVLARLLALQKFGPLSELPSLDVQMMSSWAYAKIGDRDSALAFQQRAAAMREILLNRLGSGKTPDDAIKILMMGDVAEWLRIQGLNAADVKSQSHRGRELMAVTYFGPRTAGKRELAYFELDPRTLAQVSAEVSLFTPIPLDQMKPEHRVLYEKARLKREQFLNDKTIPYLALIQVISQSMDEAVVLGKQRKFAEAIAELKNVGTIRPLKRFPYRN